MNRFLQGVSRPIIDMIGVKLLPNRIIAAQTLKLSDNASNKVDTDGETFGVGSKYAELDSVKSTLKKKRPQKAENFSDADKFGTLSDELDSV